MPMSMAPSRPLPSIPTLTVEQYLAVISDPDGAKGRLEAIRAAEKEFEALRQEIIDLQTALAEQVSALNLREQGIAEQAEALEPRLKEVADAVAAAETARLAGLKEVADARAAHVKATRAAETAQATQAQADRQALDEATRTAHRTLKTREDAVAAREKAVKEWEDAAPAREQALAALAAERRELDAFNQEVETRSAALLRNEAAYRAQVKALAAALPKDASAS